MVFFFIVTLVGVVIVGYFLYEKKVAKDATNVAQPNTGTVVPSVGKSPVDPTVTTAIIGTATEALTGRITGNGPVYSGPAVNTTRFDRLLDKPRVMFDLPQGLAQFQLPVVGGSIYQFAVSETYAPVTLTIRTQNGKELLPTCSATYGSQPRYQAQADETLVVETNAQSGGGHIAFYV